MAKAQVYKTIGGIEGIHSKQTLLYIETQKQNLALLFDSGFFKVLPKFLLEHVRRNFLRYRISPKEIDANLVAPIFEEARKGTPSSLDKEVTKFNNTFLK